jgi:uncharacterized protein YndB with AHSA1/START domain
MAPLPFADGYDAWAAEERTAKGVAATSGERDTERAIGTKLIAAGDARTAVVRRVYPASPETLWQAITDRTHLRRWFIEPRGDLRLGGTFALEGNAHGRILRCDPPRMLRVTWVYGPRHADEVEVRLAKAEGIGTLIELEHASTADTAPDGVTDALLGVGVGVGWELAMAHLGRHLDGALPLPPADGSGSALQPSPEDRQLMAASARAWMELLGTDD